MINVPKPVKIGIGISVVILLGVLGFSQFWKHSSPPSTSFITEKDTGLSSDDRAVYEKHIADADAKIASAKNDDDKYNWIIYKAQSLYAIGHLELAKETLVKAIDLRSYYLAAYATLFSVQEDMQDYVGAETTVKQAVITKSDSTDMWRKYIQLESDQFKWSSDKLDALYREALSKTQNSLDIIVSYATFLASNGQRDKAIQYWQMAAGKNPADAEQYNNEIQKLRN